MDFFSNITKSGESKTTSDQPDLQKTSNSDLFSSAKLLAEAAQAPDKCDKAKVAAASADILDAAEEYGKLDQNKGIGKYVEQAEGYLRQYGSGEKKPTTETIPETTEPEKKPAVDCSPAATKTPEISTTEGEKKTDEEGGIAGNFMKMAGGFMKK